MRTELEIGTPAWWDAQTRRSHLQGEARRRKAGWSCGCSLCRNVPTEDLPEVTVTLEAQDLPEKVPVTLPQPLAGLETAVKHPQGKRHQRELGEVAGWLREREGWSIRRLVRELKEEKGIEVSTATIWRWLKKEH